MIKDYERTLRKKIKFAKEKLPSFIDDYINELNNSNIALTTQLAYLNDITNFFEYISNIILHVEIKDIHYSQLELVTSKDIQRYKEYLDDYNVTFNNKKGNKVIMNCSNSNSGKARKIAAIKSLYKYLITEELITKNPTANIKAVQTEYRGVRDRLTKEEVEMLEATVLNGSNISSPLLKKSYERNKNRDIAIMLIFMYTGIRVSELTQLNINDVDILNYTITVNRKNNKIDKIPIPKALIDHLKPYLDERSQMSDVNSPALFISQFKKRITVKSVGNIVDKFAKRAGITKQVTCHTLRRTFLTAFYNATGDILLTKRIGGHESILTTTRFYVTSSDTRYLDEIHAFEY